MCRFCRDFLLELLVPALPQLEQVYFSGEEGKHEYGVGFFVHKDVVGAVLGCQPVSSKLISIRLRAAPFNITIIQVYAPTSGHDDSEVDHFYQQLQETIDKTPKKDIASDTMLIKRRNTCESFWEWGLRFLSFFFFVFSFLW